MIRYKLKSEQRQKKKKKKGGVNTLCKCYHKSSLKNHKLNEIKTNR